MNRRQIVSSFGSVRGDAVVVTSPGASSGLMWELARHPATIYSMELGYATSIAMGIAWGAPARRVVAFEGDGSLFAAAPVLGTIARYPPSNLIIVVVANGIWGTGEGNVETTTARVARLPDLAIACGWSAEHVSLATDPETLTASLQRALSEPGPWFIVAEAERGREDRSTQRQRNQIDPAESIITTRRDLLERR